MPLWNPLSRRNTLRLTKQWGMHSFRGQIREILTGFIPVIPLATHYLPDEERWWGGIGKATNRTSVFHPGPPPIPIGSFLWAGTELMNPAASGHDVIVHQITASLTAGTHFHTGIEGEMQLATQWPDAALGGAIYRAAALESQEHPAGLMSGIGAPTNALPGMGQKALIIDGIQSAQPTSLTGVVVAGLRFFGNSGLTINSQNQFLWDVRMPPLVIEPGGSVSVQSIRNYTVEIRLTTNWLWRVRQHV